LNRVAVDKRNMKNDYLILMDMDFSWKTEEVVGSEIQKRS